MVSESRCNPPTHTPPPLFPQQSHSIQVIVTAEAEQPIHIAANVQSRPKRPDESNLIPQISLSLSLDYKPHEDRG